MRPHTGSVTDLAGGQQEADTTEALRVESTEEFAGSSEAAPNQGKASGAESAMPPNRLRTEGEVAFNNNNVVTTNISMDFLCFPPVRGHRLTGEVPLCIDDVDNDAEFFELMQ